MREATYTDERGRQYVVLLPDHIPDSEAHRGLPIGPPPLDSLDLPAEVIDRIHNELFIRRILTERDARRRVNEIAAGLMAAIRLDAMRIAALYSEPDNLPPPPDEESVVASGPEDEPQPTPE